MWVNVYGRYIKTWTARAFRPPRSVFRAPKSVFHLRRCVRWVIELVDSVWVVPFVRVTRASRRVGSGRVGRV